MCIPAYVIRTFLTLLTHVLREERNPTPNVVRAILKYKRARRLPGTDLLDEKTVQYLCNQNIHKLWDQIVQAEKPVITPCPEEEKLPIWN